jgi:transposase
MRDIINAILYVLRSGCPWRMVPDSFAPRSTVYRWFIRLRDERVFETINHHLLIRDRERVGREASPSVLAAAARVKQDIAAGCDLVVLSKFGKLEAAGGGLSAAFTTAGAAGVPVLTSVSPALETEFQALAVSCYSVLPANAAAITAWWNTVRQRR